MTPRTLLSAAIGGSILLGCAYPWPSVRTVKECHGQHCEVKVSAARYDTPPYVCFVEDASPYEMRVKHARPVTVHWYLDSGSANDGFRFPANGIVFDNAAGWECSVQSNGLRFHCINKAGAGPHKYTINVVRGSSTCDPMDPWIVNE